MTTMQIPQDWTFKNSDVAAGFERHVREQLPWYDMATGAIAHIARHYIPEGGLVYDIGSSTGNIGRSISQTIRTRKARIVSIDNSQEMAELFDGPGKLIVSDAVDYDYEPFDLAVMFLFLMFVPVNKREYFVNRLFKLMRPGGAIVFFEKMVPDSGFFSTVSYRLTLAGKVATGTPAHEIIKKELSLSGVQRPVQSKLLYNVGARQWFQFGEFSGWITEKN